MPKPTTTPDPDPGDDRVILTRALLDEAAARRKGVHDRARRAIDGESGLIAEAIQAIPWDAVAHTEAAPMAQVSYATMRAAAQAADTLRRAGLSVETADDFATPEAVAILEGTHDPIRPADPAILAGITETIAGTITETIASDDELRTKAAVALLVEAWASIAADPATEDDPTGGLIDRLYTAGGWAWLAGHRLRWADLIGNANTLAPMDALPAFVEGYGRTDNHAIAIGARRAMSADYEAWITGSDGRPEFRYENDGGDATVMPDRAHFPTADDAIAAVQRYGEASHHAGTLLLIMAKHHRNRDAGNLGPNGGFYLGVEEIAKAFGIAKHVNGGYPTSERRRLIEVVEDLTRIEVKGSMRSYGKGGPIVVSAPLIVISQRVRQEGLAGGEGRLIGWYVRPGDWNASNDRITLPFARRTDAVLKLHGRRDKNAARLAWALEEAYRIRAQKRTWNQAYRVCDLLEAAGITPDRKHPQRFRERIEAALNILRNPAEMNGTPVVATWSYPTPIAATGRGWFDRWLDAGLTITPDAATMEQYASMGTPRTRRRRSKAAIPAQT